MDRMKQIQNAKKLLADVDKKIKNWNERSLFRLKGVGNLSRSDMDTLQLYAEHFIQNNGYLYGLMQPLGNIGEVLEKYEIHFV